MGGFFSLLLWPLRTKLKNTSRDPSESRGCQTLASANVSQIHNAQDLAKGGPGAAALQKQDKSNKTRQDKKNGSH